MSSSLVKLWRLPFLLLCSLPTEEYRYHKHGDYAKDSKDPLTANNKPLKQPKKNVYKFPPAKRLPAISVGDVVKVNLKPGTVHKRITRATRIPIFEIPNFLSSEECRWIIQNAKHVKLKTSDVSDGETNATAKNTSEIIRLSKTTWLEEVNVGSKFWNKLHKRLSKLTELPIGVIQRSEPLQVVNYGPAGHYDAHWDSMDDTRVPCCFHTRCKFKDQQCCRYCRFMTVMYYLNDVTHGGETAFPVADLPDELVTEKINDHDNKWHKLSYYCHNSSVVVSPKKGTAVMWYSHLLDDKGYLGKLDSRSVHGGCDIIKGEKWIATSWISVTTYADRFKQSKYFSGT